MEMMPEMARWSEMDAGMEMGMEMHNIPVQGRVLALLQIVTVVTLVNSKRFALYNATMDPIEIRNCGHVYIKDIVNYRKEQEKRALSSSSPSPSPSPSPSHNRWLQHQLSIHAQRHQVWGFHHLISLSNLKTLKLRIHPNTCYTGTQPYPMMIDINHLIKSKKHFETSHHHWCKSVECQDAQILYQSHRVEAGSCLKCSKRTRRRF